MLFLFKKHHVSAWPQVQKRKKEIKVYNHGSLAELVAKFLIKKIKPKDIFIRQRCFKKHIFFMCLQKKKKQTLFHRIVLERSACTKVHCD